MIVVLSGEGKSDLGHCGNSQGQCRTPDFIPGPMTWLADQIIAQRLQYSLLDDTPFQYIFIAKPRLLALEQQRKLELGKISLPGKKREQETAYFHINAWMLGEEALRLQEEHRDQAIAILFRDRDGTNSAHAGLWEDKWNSLVSGFARSRLDDRGVPMLPKPISEAWLLCAAQAHPYQNCAALEDMPGNDKSPNDLKSALKAAYGRNLSSVEQVEWLREHGYDDEEAASQMPSLQKFRHSLHVALTSLGLPPHNGVQQ